MARRPSYQRVERNIYLDQRNGAFRFRVCVYPLEPETRTFDSVADGKVWALKMRAELAERKHGVAIALRHGTPATGVAPTPAATPETSARALADETVEPAAHLVSVLLDDYEATALPALADTSEAGSRLRNLRKWFGEKRLGELTQHFLDRWLEARLSGRLGSGRTPTKQDVGEGGVRLTKDQRRRRRARTKASGQEVEPVPVMHPPSTQTARHELRYLRRAVKHYFVSKGLMEEHASWLLGRPLMTMPLPAPSEPRDRRLSDAEFFRIIRSMKSREAQYATLLALATGLRRSEIVSLRWEDVDTGRRVVRLRSPGYRRSEGETTAGFKRKSSKTHTRDVPLTDEALTLLARYGIKPTGRLFILKPASVTQAWKRAVDRADIPDARLHDVRREALSRLVDDFDLPLQLVTVFSGHRDLATLQRHYLLAPM